MSRFLTNFGTLDGCHCRGDDKGGRIARESPSIYVNQIDDPAITLDAIKRSFTSSSHAKQAIRVIALKGLFKVIDIKFDNLCLMPSSSRSNRHRSNPFVNFSISGKSCSMQSSHSRVRGQTAIVHISVKAAAVCLGLSLPGHPKSVSPRFQANRRIGLCHKPPNFQSCNPKRTLRFFRTYTDFTSSLRGSRRCSCAPCQGHRARRLRKNRRSALSHPEPDISGSISIYQWSMVLLSSLEKRYSFTQCADV
jgi:hypothetical protein